MSTTRFNTNIVTAARRLQNQRTTAAATGDDGGRYSSALLSDYQNRGIRNLLQELYAKLGMGFGDAIPEMMRNSNIIPMTAGRFTKPLDAYHVMELVRSDYSTKFYKLPDDRIEQVKAGRAPDITPTVNRPVFWEQGDIIYTLPASVSAWSVIARYIRVHQDISVITGATGPGNFLTGGSQWFDTIKAIGAIMNVPFAVGDENKFVVFKDDATDIVYNGRIQSAIAPTGYTQGEVVVLYGDDLPTADIALIDAVLVIDENLDNGDILLNPNFDGEIVDRIVALAQADAQRQTG